MPTTCRSRVRPSGPLVICLTCLSVQALLASLPAQNGSRSPWTEAGKSRMASPPRKSHRSSRTGPRPRADESGGTKFENIDRFFSREQLANRIRSKLSPPEWLKEYWKGKVDQDRNYFWYRKTFRAPARGRCSAQDQQGPIRDSRLAERPQAGRIRWLFLGQLLPVGESHPLERGEHAGGAHRRASRRTAGHYPTGSDFEKIRWTPGIYDSVTLSFCDNPRIQSIQVAPRLASSRFSCKRWWKTAAPMGSSSCGIR